MSDEYLHNIVKKWKLLRRNDLKKEWGDLIVFRKNVRWDDYESSKTIYSIWHWYWFEFCNRHTFWWTFGTYHHNIDVAMVEIIKEFIKDNIEQIKWIWKLEEEKNSEYWSIIHGYVTELYFSDWKEWYFFSYTSVNDYKWENMGKLLKIEREFELKILKYM